MGMVIPQVACVRPRGRLRAGAPSLPLDDLLEEYLEDHPTGILWLDGPAGAGKSTALAHLAAHFVGDERIRFYDDVAFHEMQLMKDFVLLVVAGRRPDAHTHRKLELELWGLDELVEYLLAAHPEQCQSVMERLGRAAHQRWVPVLARIVLDGFAGNPSMCDPHQAILNYLEQNLTSPEQVASAQRVAMLHQTSKYEKAFLVMSESLKRLPPDVRALLSHDWAQLPLAASYLVDAIRAHRADYQDLQQSLPPALVRAVARQIAAHPKTLQRLKRKLRYFSARSEQPMIASILFAVDPGWKPAPGSLARLHLSGGYFPEANWQNITLVGNDLSGCDLRQANFRGVTLSEASLHGASLCQADLRAASMVEVKASHVDFERANLVDAVLSRAKLRHARFVQTKMDRCQLAGANLQRADLTNASLYRAVLTRACLQSANLTSADMREADLSSAKLLEADLTDTDLRQANLTCVDGRSLDFRTARLEGAHAPLALFCRANMEDVVWHNADLQEADLSLAHLTGSQLPRANLKQAKLREAGLGEINWEGADLRGADLCGATFHMGSSRSGLVVSPFASEGTRTGFYTDDLEEIYFKRPEEVRKANLRGADMRGANVANVDFYLVDLRDAKLDRAQLRQALQTGAILTEGQEANE